MMMHLREIRRHDDMAEIDVEATLACHHSPLSLRQLAKLVGLSHGMLAALIKDGDFPADGYTIDQDNVYLIEPDAALRWWRDHEYDPNA